MHPLHAGMQPQEHKVGHDVSPEHSVSPEHPVGDERTRGSTRFAPVVALTHSKRSFELSNANVAAIGCGSTGKELAFAAFRSGVVLSARNVAKGVASTQGNMAKAAVRADRRNDCNIMWVGGQLWI